MSEILNRITKSPLVTIDMDDLYPRQKRIALVLDDWLDGGVLRENEFRQKIKTHDWQSYAGCLVAIIPPKDTIVPSWAYMLLAAYLAPITKKTVVGSLEILEVIVFEDIINNLDLAAYKEAPVIIKGCRKNPIPEQAYLLLVEKLQPIVKSLSYGEACSTVPLLKNSK